MATTLSSVSIARFLRSMSVNGRSENTVRGYRADLTGLLEALDPTKPSLFDPELGLEEAAAKYLTAGRVTWQPKTTERKLTAFRSWAKWAGMPDFLADYKAPKPARAMPHPLDEGIDGVMAMIAKCEPWARHHQALVALCGLCGLRVHEALLIRPSHIDVGQMRLRFVGKGGVQRNVPISTRAWPVLEKAMETAMILGDDPLVGLKDRQARTILKQLARRAGLVGDHSSHDLRATLGTAAYDKTGDLRAVQEVLGHASSRTTEIYTRVSERAMRTAVEV